MSPAALAAIAIAVLFCVWLLFIRGGDDEDEGSGSEPKAPELVAEQDLSGLAEEVGHPVYWAGPKEGMSVEARVDEDGNVFIRYLPEGVPAGADQPLFLSVGSYPLPDPFGALRRISTQPGAKEIELANGGLAVVNNERPEHVYLAYPDAAVQIEVFDPSPKIALATATSGEVQPVP